MTLIQILVQLSLPTQKMKKHFPVQLILLKSLILVAFGTDPDCDRVGIAVKNKNKFDCLSGNQVAVILAEYRLQQLRQKQLINIDNSKGFAILKTFVTTGMLDKIAKTLQHCVSTPTGFKWMAQKLKNYEKKAKDGIYENEGIGLDYDKLELFRGCLSSPSTRVIQFYVLKKATDIYQ